MEQRKVEEEHPRKEVCPLYRPDTNRREHLAQPNHTQHTKRQKLIPTIILNQEKYHPYHDWNKD